MTAPADGIARRYAEWVDARRWWLLVGALVIAVVGGLLTARLPIHGAVSHLLPRESRSVRDLLKLKQRVHVSGSALIVVAARDRATRRRVAQAAYRRCQAIDPSLLSEITIDDGVARRYGWRNRFLFVDMADLQSAHDALQEKIRKAKLAANPGYIDLEDEDDDDATRQAADAELEARITRLREKLDDAERGVKSPTAFVSPDGRVQVIVMRTSHNSGTTEASRLVASLREIVGDLRTEFGDDAEIGLTGTVPQTALEHESILRGMSVAALLTLVIVSLALFLFYRSVLPVVASLASMLLGVLVTFGITYLTVGHLNLMTAFLSAIVIGNGINSGLMLLARYFEEVRKGRVGNDGLAAAIAGALPGTLAAAVTAGVAYASLIVTEFRGFCHFGVIAGIGMVACWITAFTVLPAALCVLRRRGLIRVKPAPSVGPILARLVPRRLVILLGGSAVLLAGASVLAVMYVQSDPFLVNWDRLRTDNGPIRTARQWDARSRPAFSRERATAAARSFAMALSSRDQVGEVATYLRDVNNVAESNKLFGTVRVVEDLLPKQQDAKLKLLASIRNMLDDDVLAEFDEADRATLRRVMPPADLRTLTVADIPRELAWPFVERDGTVGRLIIASQHQRFETWNVRHRTAFARGVRELELPEDILVGGQSFVVADIITSMRRDGPVAIAVALIGSALAIFLLVGFSRSAAVTLACMGLAMVLMVALCAIAGLRIHFMDLIAVPITIGIGADYAVNLVARDRQDPTMGVRRVLRTTGGAVLLCSFTTMVGYGSLLLSSNGGIREFGLAAILGELACVGVALFVAPTLLSYLRGKRTA